MPAGYLFNRVWQDNDESRTNTKLEHQGVDYLTTLSPLVSALAEFQSTALQGISAVPASLTTAVSQVTAADQRLGVALQTRTRWTGLREKIAKLPTVAGDPQTIFQSHVEVADLALALYNAVRGNSTLVRDPDNDLSHLQQAVAVDLPNTVIQVNRMGDLSLMLAKVSGTAAQQATQRATLGPQFGAAVQAVNTAVNSLTDNLQAAVDDTKSPTLSGNLVTSLDSFRRGVESLTRGANPGGAPATAAMATAQSQLQTSLTTLSGVTLREMGNLLQGRLDTLDRQRIEALAAACAVVLLLLAALIIRRTGRRRRTGTTPGDGGSTRGLPARQFHPETGYGSLIDPSYGEVDPTRRERSGAVR